MIIFICYDPNIFSIEKIIQVEMYTGKLKNSQNSNIIMKHKLNSSRAKIKQGQRMSFSILQFSDILKKDAKTEIIDFFVRKHLLSSAKVCPDCSSAMQLEKRADISDGYR